MDGKIFPQQLKLTMVYTGLKFYDLSLGTPLARWRTGLGMYLLRARQIISKISAQTSMVNSYDPWEPRTRDSRGTSDADMHRLASIIAEQCYCT
jgi:hypothetical protein